MGTEFRPPPNASYDSGLAALGWVREAGTIAILLNTSSRERACSHNRVPTAAVPRQTRIREVLDHAVDKELEFSGQLLRDVALRVGGAPLTDVVARLIAKTKAHMVVVSRRRRGEATAVVHTYILCVHGVLGMPARWWCWNGPWRAHCNACGGQPQACHVGSPCAGQWLAAGLSPPSHARHPAAAAHPRTCRSLPALDPHPRSPASGCA